MRTSAQPVALVNTFLPPEHAKSATRTRSSDKDTTPDPDPDDESEERWIHGATLSSFSSISLQPPLISFAIRTPSRLSDSLKHAYLQSKDAASRPTSEPFPSPSSSSSLSSEGEQNQPRPRKGHFILNLLAAEQVDLAGTYARPGLDPLRYPLPPPTSSSNDSSTRHPLLQHPVTPTAEAAGIPRLDDALGSFTCAVVDAINLASYSPTVAPAAADPHSNAHAHAHAPESSILYIAQILNVYKGSGSTPLLYCNQKFVKPAHGI
ncbi:hypothetical protein BCV70DRAFT_202400 [Testicularia cyperi]|uniref:Flavin reductase like domain-containing protein n=1 Tax=Testicularia cyperi TaxID=1882483 RepID=A0A317XJF4_9BASI|nr:hypothetical protein BCV70DRAFT_202400 [Testicularia cyperi]